LSSICTSISPSTLLYRDLGLTIKNYRESWQLSSTSWIPRAPSFLRLASSCPTMLFRMSPIQWSIHILVLFALVNGLMVLKTNLEIGLRTICQSFHLLRSSIGTQTSRKSKLWVAIQWVVGVLWTMWSLKNSKKSSCFFRNTMWFFRRRNSMLRVLLSNHNLNGPLSQEK
jgi:hypothetical protein